MHGTVQQPISVPMCSFFLRGNRSHLILYQERRRRREVLRKKCFGSTCGRMSQSDLIATFPSFDNMENDCSPVSRATMCCKNWAPLTITSLIISPYGLKRCVKALEIVTWKIVQRRSDGADATLESMDGWTDVAILECVNARVSSEEKYVRLRWKQLSHLPLHLFSTLQGRRTSNGELAPIEQWRQRLQ